MGCCSSKTMFDPDSGSVKTGSDKSTKSNKSTSVKSNESTKKSKNYDVTSSSSSSQKKKSTKDKVNPEDSKSKRSKDDDKSLNSSKKDLKMDKGNVSKTGNDKNSKNKNSVTEKSVKPSSLKEKSPKTEPSKDKSQKKELSKDKSISKKDCDKPKEKLNSPSSLKKLSLKGPSIDVPTNENEFTNDEKNIKISSKKTKELERPIKSKVVEFDETPIRPSKNASTKSWWELEGVDDGFNSSETQYTQDEFTVKSTFDKVETKSYISEDLKESVALTSEVGDEPENSDKPKYSKTYSSEQIEGVVLESMEDSHSSGKSVSDLEQIGNLSEPKEEIVSGTTDKDQEDPKTEFEPLVSDVKIDRDDEDSPFSLPKRPTVVPHRSGFGSQKGDPFGSVVVPRYKRPLPVKRGLNTYGARQTPTVKTPLEEICDVLNKLQSTHETKVDEHVKLHTKIIELINKYPSELTNVDSNLLISAVEKIILTGGDKRTNVSKSSIFCLGHMFEGFGNVLNPTLNDSMRICCKKAFSSSPEFLVKTCYFCLSRICKVANELRLISILSSYYKENKAHEMGSLYGLLIVIDRMGSSILKTKKLDLIVEIGLKALEKGSLDSRKVGRFILGMINELTNIDKYFGSIRASEIQKKLIKTELSKYDSESKDKFIEDFCKPLSI